MPTLSARTMAAAAMCACLAGCGYVGDPLPPSLNIPRPVADLHAWQSGSTITLEFTVPELTTDGVLLRRVREVEIRGGAVAAGGAFDVDQWAAQAKAVPNDITQPGPARVEVPVQGWVGQEVIFGVRVASPKGHFSGWSNLAVQQVVAPLEPPSGLKAEAVPAGVRLTWQTPRAVPGLTFRIYRRADPHPQSEQIGEADRPEYVDTSSEYGRTYEYSVQTVLKGSRSTSESAISAPVAITPKDVFPPATPAGLTAIPSIQSIELNWDRNSEPDLKGYYVYRSSGGGPLERLGEVETPSYSDKKIQSGTRYGYAVSAVDQLGNESPRSAPVEITAP